MILNKTENLLDDLMICNFENSRIKIKILSQQYKTYLNDYNFK